MDFLAENNACGQTLLQLVSRGHAIIAELVRLSDFVPEVYAKTSKPSEGTYDELICDFSYFKLAEQFEAKIEASQQLQDLDEELRENYIDILTRFYMAFESVQRYAGELQRYIEELEEGTYIQQNVESVLMTVDGKQLMSEAIYLLGTMLLVVDSEIDGPIRERILVSFYRYNSRIFSGGLNIDEVCRLFRGTGRSKRNRPPNYPESYFQRVTLNKACISMVIGRLRQDDIYNQLAAFPLPEHRSTALAAQSAMLYVCLYFVPDILNTKEAIMREIVDKFFSDNWVITIYMGRIVNLLEAWEPYRAARAALANVCSENTVKTLADRYLNEFKDVNKGLATFLNEGALTKEFILSNVTKILNALRRCNVLLRWMMLHSAVPKPEWQNVKKCLKYRTILIDDARFDFRFVFGLLLNTSQFELAVKEKYRQMLGNRQTECVALQKDISDRIAELAEVFSGSRPLSRVAKNEKLFTWFNDVRQQVDQLTFDDVLSVGRKLVQLMRSLEEVQEFYSLDVTTQIRQFLADIQQVMHQLLRTLSMKEDTLVQMQIICDFSYAWEIIEDHNVRMQQGIQNDASMAIRLSSTFIKLSSALDLPLLRIQQANSPDLVSVSQFYSRVLVLYIRQILQVVPQTVFRLLAKIVTLQTRHIEELPTRLDKNKLKEYARLDERYEVARLTHAISVLTEGVLMMKVTLVGSIRVDPKQLLEDGIRKELVQQVSYALNSLLLFNVKPKEKIPLKVRLNSLANEIDGYRRSFEYISDYIGLSGLKIWQEEFTRIVNYNVEQECNNFVRHKVEDWESVYQSKLIPIPRFPPVDSNFGFIGRLAHEIMKETDPRATVYIHHVATWYDAKTHKEAITVELFKTLLKSIGNIGAVGLDRLFGFLIVNHLQRFNQLYTKLAVNNSDTTLSLENAAKTIGSPCQIIDQPSKFYSSLITKYTRLVGPLCDEITKIGHMQIIRLHIVREMNNACKFQSKLLEHALQTLNRTVLSDICASNSVEFQSENESALLYELTNYLETAGITEVLKKVYVTPVVLPYLEVAIFIMILVQVPRLNYVKNVGLLSKRPNDSVDGIPFVVGVLTLMRQYGTETMLNCLRYISQLLNSFVNASLSAKGEMPNDALVMTKFILELAEFGGVGLQQLEEVVPRLLLSEHQILF